jgi:hypothetical protein
MDIILKSTLNGKHDHFPADTTPTSPDPSPFDPWLFTDPFARDLYMHRNLIDQLEEDIRTYVMLDGCWASEELECKFELRRLLQEGFIVPVGSFGYLSPHPTVYRTLKEGILIVSRQQYAFRSREDLIFEPWLARYSDPGLNAPLRIGQLYHVSSPCLCCDSFPHICIHCDNTMGIMRQILSYRNNQK